MWLELDSREHKRDATAVSRVDCMRPRSFSSLASFMNEITMYIVLMSGDRLSGLRLTLICFCVVHFQIDSLLNHF